MIKVSLVKQTVPSCEVSLLTDVVQADPVGGVHFLFDVPGDDQVAVS